MTTENVNSPGGPPVRRLPVYLVLDCSASMAGEPIEAVRRGVKCFLDDLRIDPQALETVCISVITFADTAVQTCPLTRLDSFQAPEDLKAEGGAALGAALSLLEQCLETEVRKPVPDRHKGDWKPLVFLMSAGRPTDSWEGAADSIRARRLYLYALAAGESADSNVLKRITETVLHLKDLRPSNEVEFQKLFRWQFKVRVGAATPPSDCAALPPPPPGFDPVP